MQNAITFLNGENMGLIFALLWALDNLLASYPKIKANSAFQLCHGILMKIKGFFK